MRRTRHHRRHHTWPQCGSDLCLREPCGLKIHVSNTVDGPATYTYNIPLYLQQSTAAPISTQELLCDDIIMPELSRQPKRMSRLWFRSSVRRSDQSSLSGPPGQTKQVYRSVLRRLTRRPPLNKTRSLFVIPTNMKSDGSYMMPRFIPPDELDKPAVPSDSDKWRSFMSRSDTAGFMGEGRHRRCHSEQPRAWRKPSASLWTLQESEE